MKSQQHINVGISGGRKPKREWKIGWTLILIVLGTFAVTIFSCIFASSRDLQIQLIRRTGGTSSVLRVQQGLGIVLRVFASFLAWGIMSDLAWCLLTRGPKGREAVQMLDLAAIGDSYTKAVQTIWTHLRRLNGLPLLAIGLVTLLAVAADLVGVAMVASTSVSTYPLELSYDVPFVDTDDGFFQASGSDNLMAVYASGGSYPYILRTSEGFVMVPLLGTSIPSSYAGPAMVGNLETKCVEAFLTGTISYAFGFRAPTISMNGSAIIRESLQGLPSTKPNLSCNSSFEWVPAAGDRENPTLILACTWSGEKPMGPIYDPGPDCALYYNGNLLLLTVAKNTFGNDLVSEASDQSSGTLGSSEGTTTWSLVPCTT